MNNLLKGNENNIKYDVENLRKGSKENLKQNMISHQIGVGIGTDSFKNLKIVNLKIT